MINKHLLIGEVVSTIDYRLTQSGKSKAKFRLRSWRLDKDGKEVSKFHSVECWDKLADAAKDQVEKGFIVMVEGPNETDVWDRHGEKKYFNKTVALTMKITSRTRAQNASQTHEDQNSTALNPEGKGQEGHDAPGGSNPGFSADEPPAGF